MKICENKWQGKFCVDSLEASYDKIWTDDYCFYVHNISAIYMKDG